MSSRRDGVIIHLVVNAEGLVGVLDQLMNREGGVVRLDDGVRDLRGGHDGERSHHAVWEFFTDLGNEQGTHTSTGTTTKRVSDLEALKTVTALSFATDDIEDLIDKLSTLGVVTFGPVIA